MADGVEEYIAWLRSDPDDWRPQAEHVRELATRDDLTGLRRWLDATDAVTCDASESLRRHVLHACAAMPDPEAARLALRRAAGDRSGIISDRVAAFHGLDAVVELLGQDDLPLQARAELLYASVLRGADYRHEPCAVAIAKRAAQPTGGRAMPLHLLPIECEFPACSANYAPGSSASAWSVRTVREEALPPGRGWSLTEHHDSALARTVEAVFEDGWGLEVVAYRCDDRPLNSGVVPSIQLEALRGEVELTRTRAEIALVSLYAASLHGGAYTSGVSPGRARAAAWSALATMVGLAPDASFDMVERVALSSDWAEFRSPWFHQIAWDVGIVARSGTRLVVLAATDCD